MSEPVMPPVSAMIAAGRGFSNFREHIKSADEPVPDESLEEAQARIKSHSVQPAS